MVGVEVLHEAGKDYFCPIMEIMFIHRAILASELHCLSAGHHLQEHFQRYPHNMPFDSANHDLEVVEQQLYCKDEFHVSMQNSSESSMRHTQSKAWLWVEGLQECTMD